MGLEKNKFKKTELGLIPQDWEIITLKDVGDVKMCRRIFSYQTKEQGDIPFYKIGTFGKKPDAFITIELYNEYKKKFSFPKVGDILISASGTIGRTVIYTGKDAYFQDSNIIWIDNNNKFISNDYLQYVYKVIKYRTEGGTIQRLYNNIIYDTPVICPPLPEQQAIAAILSDTDNLINSLTQQLAKKRAIKQGTMQALLKPKEDWEVKTILELADSKKQLFDDGDWIESEHITTEGIRLIQTGNIGVGKYVEKENKKFIYEASFEKLNCKQLQEGDLLICRLAEPAGRACILPKLPYDKIVTSVDVTIFRPRTEVANRTFLMNIFSTPEWFKQVYESVGGTTHKRISRGSLGKVSIKLPPIEEQTRIATILSDMDAEIAQLEEKLAKYKVVKQGLMQQLLTGNIRVV